MCKKNKIDVVKAICNSVAKKLAVLSLAVAVSSSAVASAQTDPQQRWNCEKSVREVMLEEIARREGNSTTIERLDAINRELYELGPIVDDVVDQYYSLLYKLEKEDLDEAERKDLQAQLEEADAKREEVVDKFYDLRRARRAMLDPFNDRLSVTDNLCISLMFNIEEVVSGTEIDRDGFVYACLTGLGFQEDAVRRIMEFFGYDLPLQNQEVDLNMTLPLRPQQPLLSQQRQQHQHFGGSFNPLNWGLFGGKK